MASWQDRANIFRSMADPVRRRATYEDVLAVPEDMIAQVIDGELHVHPRPRRRHIRAASTVGGFLSGAFDTGVNGPGGWVVLDEPELHLGSGPDILVPDLAAWRDEHFPGDVDDDAPFFTVAPDWTCEILSDRTARLDRMRKVPIYAREGVGHVWIVDPRDRTVEVLRLHEGQYVLIGTSGGDEETFVLEPFGAVPIPPFCFWGRRKPSAR